MVRIIRRARRDQTTQPRMPALDERTLGIWRDFKAVLIGNKGEARVAERLAGLGLPALHDVLLPAEDAITQIDHIVRGPAAIFVLETKAWSGEITGAIGDVEWRQRLDGGRIDNQVPNPIRQNAWHVKAVSTLLAQHTPKTLVEGHVVMAGRAELEPWMRERVLDVDGLERLGTGGAAPAEAFASLMLAWAQLCDAAARGRHLREAHRAAIDADRLT